MAATFRWTPAYSVNISKFDRQHQLLFETAEELHQALGAGHGKDVIGKILQRLIDYTGQHFAAEESVMEANSYPGLTNHRAEHKALVDHVLSFQKQFLEGQSGVPTALMPFLQKWLHNHILHTDKEYGPFLNEKGIH